VIYKCGRWLALRASQIIWLEEAAAKPHLESHL
jgi:hypothetical protein